MENILNITSLILITGLSGLLFYSYTENQNNLNTISNLENENLELVSEIQKYRALNKDLISANEQLSNALGNTGDFIVEHVEDMLDVNPLKWSLLFSYDLFSAYYNIKAYSYFLEGEKSNYMGYYNFFEPMVFDLKALMTNSVNNIFSSLNNENYFSYSPNNKEIIFYELDNFVNKVSFFTQDYSINHIIDGNALKQNTILTNGFGVESRFSFVMKSSNYSLPYSFSKNYRRVPNFYNKDFQISEFISE